MQGHASDLVDLYFGRDDAETDISDGGLLRAGFLETAAYRAAQMARKHLIIGRKGSGKSAICRTLAASPDETMITLLVTPDEVSADEMRRFALQGITAEKAKELIWRYVLSIGVAKYLVAHAQAWHASSKLHSVEAVRKFLVANKEVDDPNFQEKFWRAVQKLKASFSLEAFGIKVGANVGWPSEGVRAASQLGVVEKNVKKALADLACDKVHPRLLILIDQVDDVWSDEVESHQMVVGLLRAARLLSSNFPRVACVVFLRSDIYDVLQFFDKDKLHSEEMRVDWTGERLLQMVFTRAQASLGRSIPPEYLWKTIFPPSIDGVASQDYVVSRTLMRPRDMIHFCNLCRDTAEQNGHATITEADALFATVQYSQWKLQDLTIEYRVNYPFLGGLIGIFQDSGYIVLRDGLDRRFAEAADTLRRRYPEHIDSLTTEGVLDVLFDIGFLGVRRDDRITFGYVQGASLQPTDSEFFIHPCFRPALRSVTATIKDHYHPKQLQSHVRSGLRGVPGQPRRATPEFVLLRSVTRGGDRILEGLNNTGFPPEARKEISREIHSVLRDTDEIGAVLRELGSVDVVSHVYDVAEFLTGLARQLKRNGFCANDKGRSFMRSIEDLARQLRQEASGSGPVQS